MSKLAVAFVGACLGGALVYAWTGPSAPAPRATVEVPAAPRGAPERLRRADAPVDPRQLEAMLRSVVQEELAARGGSADTAPTPDESPAPRAANSVRAEATGIDLVGAAAARGRWNDDDNLRLHELMAELDPEAIEAINAAWVGAINRQELRPDTPLRF